LQTRQARDRAGLFFIEGIRFVAQAMRQDVPVETLVVAPGLLLNPFGQKLVRLLRGAGTPCLTVSPDVFRHISLALEPQGIGAVIQQRWHPLERVRPSDGLCWIALDEVQSPGNLGSIVRTADAVGAAGVVLLGTATDPFHPTAVRASMGSMFSQRFVRASPAEFAAWKNQHACTLIGTSPTAALDYRAARYQPPVVLFMGCERQGLSQEHQAMSDLMVKIPMVGRCDSLNLAVATGVMLYEIFNQRHTPR
jgi:TrmH family RNA methyltransferase